MKTYLTYGAGMAVANLLFNLILFFTGFHTDAEKMGSGLGSVIGYCGLLAIGITGLVLGIKARRAEVPEGEPFGYGQAFGAGMMITVFAALFGIVTSYLYFGIINANFGDVIYQVQVAKMEAKGMSADKIAQAEPIMRKFMSLPAMIVFGVVGTIFWNTILGLIVAAFTKRPNPQDAVSL